jgi:hypothetical protein
MKLPITAALALFATTSLHAQTAPTPPASTSPAASTAPAASTSLAIDLSIATPLSGNWTYAPATDGSEATFIDSGARPQLTLQCQRATRQVTIAKLATAAAAPLLSIWTSSQTRAVPASFNPATTRLTATLPAFDPLLDSMAFSRGRIGVTTAGQAPLVLPPWEEVARVIEDCRV